MKPPMKLAADTVRRRFVLASVGAGTALVTGCISGGEGDSMIDRKLSFASLAAAAEEITKLSRAHELTSSATWNWAQTLVHCAQSIEYSMSGFPEPKSRLFQKTIGSAAIGVFSWRGRMTHDLAEPIPGAPTLDIASDSSQAIERLQASVSKFASWSKPLQPYFAYGELTKERYELAHAMHLANHLSAFRAKT